MENFKKQYRKDNPFDVKQKGALGRYGYDLTMFEYDAEVRALSYRDAMKKANGGQNVTDTNRTPAQGNITKTVNINVNGVRTSINTDDAGEDAGGMPGARAARRTWYRHQGRVPGSTDLRQPQL